ncbi:pilus assembly protein PilM [Trinickia sp. LjRoot230]|uniref:pilus assembly protein PilM n=1 Tax=Trinickia sp. LjRoot230 TaxID=3342288 RepID=UPI003ECEC853
MLVGKRFTPAVRRFAAGIDLSAREARLVVLSRRGARTAPVRVEWLSVARLERSAMAGGHVVDRAGVAAALSALFAQWSARRSVRTLRCSMAVPPSVTWVASLRLPHRQRPHAGADAAMAELAASDALEAAACAHAEHIAGIEREALAIDWCVEDAAAGWAWAPQPGADVGRPYLAVAAAARQHLESRMEAAAAAGIALAAIDGEPPAALRALCHAASFEVGGDDCYAALWIGDDGLYGWCIADGAIKTQIRYPTLEHSDLCAALRELGGGLPLECAFAGGDLGALAGIGTTLADIGDLLGCTVLPFECAPFVDAATCVLPASAAALTHAPRFAVAFGLALRGVGA